MRQCPDRYTIRAGRNLPDKEFRYLRTVIVTAAVYRGFNSELSLLLLTFRHRAGVSPYTSSFDLAETCVFAKQSPGPILCGSFEHSLFRSYGVNLPSSLTTLLPLALEFSSCPPVSVCGTGTYKTIAAFLDSQGPGLPYLCSVRVTSSDRAADLPTALLPRLHRDLHSRIPFPVCVPTVLFICGTGISTCYPSTTSFDLALGPDLPRADQLYSGNLRYSA